MPDNDPRVFFAAERTLLAWVRTAIGLVGLGFVVAKFALFMKIMRPDVEHPTRSWSAAVGVVLAVLGAIASGMASWQHRRFCRTLTASELPPRYRADPALWLGFGVAVVGAALAVVIAV
jgi:putative membrane protein